MSLSPQPLRKTVRAALRSACGKSPRILKTPVPYTVRNYLNAHSAMPLLERTNKHLRIAGGRTGVVCIRGVYIALLASAFEVLYSEANALVAISIHASRRAGSTIHKTFLAGESAKPGKALLTGSRPSIIRVRLKNGCWPVFQSSDAAKQFCPTNWPLQSMRIGKATHLFYGAWKSQYVCIECHERFTSPLQILTHVGLPLPSHGTPADREA